MDKLKSRKFWIAVSTMLSGLLMLVGLADSTIEAITGAILIVGPAISYMVVEYKLDSKSMNDSFDALMDLIEAIKNDETLKKLFQERITRQ